MQAILLMGPTGSGKTPLGDYCEEKGIWGRKCAHFDFGEQLRKIAGNVIELPLLTSDDSAVIVDSLKTGALLENENFHIAKRILEGFIEEKNLGGSDILLLNGMPRHKEQANDLNGLVNIVMVLNLQCEAKIVHQRIASNSGGDRGKRIDDSIEEIEKKLNIYNERTLPLLERYSRKGVAVEGIKVDIGMSAQDMHKKLEHFSRQL